ncbi:hypothetical protein [Streptomyces varsoviensis]|uniref:hypothetical protein n=1 Tax=Streptomyces varsoviensis TaxID=67373 RepID=UPI003F4D3284
MSLTSQELATQPQCWEDVLGLLADTAAALPAELAERIEATGAHLRRPALDPLAGLVLAQRVAVRLAEGAGRSPDSPAHLTRSVVLS